MNMKSIAAIALISMTMMGVAAAEDTAKTGLSGSNDVEIHQVMAQFQKALKDKKKDDILALFVTDDVPVTASASDKTLARVRAKKADAAKILFSTSEKFATEIGAGKDSPEERFSNIKIDSDGAVAAVSFDFVFLGDGKPLNIGKEAWLLVNTEKGWKISSIAYSMNFPDQK